jgi:hypothetical protein
VGADNVLAQEPTMGAEDFSYMLQAKPGCYCFIANGDGDHRAMGHGGGPCTLHNPSYDFNDALIPLGATYWVRLAHSGWPSPGRPHDRYHGQAFSSATRRPRAVSGGRGHGRAADRVAPHPLQGP